MRDRLRFRVRKSQVFLVFWICMFVLALYLVPSISVVILAILSLTYSAISFGFAYLLFRLLRGRFGAKALAVFLLLVLVGAGYQNQSALSLNSVSELYRDGNAAIMTFIANAAQPRSSGSSINHQTAASSSTESMPASATSTVQSTNSRSSVVSASQSESTQQVENSNWLVDNPSFQDGKATVDYPPDFGVLANFTLNLVNQDRASAGLSAVSLSTVPSGQQHADSMDYFDYFSHWDVQGYKPYMRYTLSGGTGAVAENVGMNYCTTSPASASEVFPTSCSIQSIENGIANSEWQMINNDAACCANGHRDNILDPLHTSISIGIAYNTTTSALYFVEDFENSYIALNAPILGANDEVTISGAVTGSQQISQLTVYYDPIPQAMSVSQLDSTFSYSPGTFVGGVFPPCTNACSYYPGAVSVYASSWTASSAEVNIQFSLNSFIQADGPGVYTIYLTTGSSTDTAILMYSVFINS